MLRAYPVRTWAVCRPRRYHSMDDRQCVDLHGSADCRTLQRRAPELKKMTGAETSQSPPCQTPTCYKTSSKDQHTGTTLSGFRAVPTVVGDFVTPGYLQPLDDMIKAVKDIQFDDIEQFFRNFSRNLQRKDVPDPARRWTSDGVLRTDVLAKAKRTRQDLG